MTNLGTWCPYTHAWPSLQGLAQSTSGCGGPRSGGTVWGSGWCGAPTQVGVGAPGQGVQCGAPPQVGQQAAWSYPQHP